VAGKLTQHSTVFCVHIFCILLLYLSCEPDHLSVCAMIFDDSTIKNGLVINYNNYYMTSSSSSS